MVVQATLMLLGLFSVMLLAGVPVLAETGIASAIIAIMSGIDGNTFVLTAAQKRFSGCDPLSLLAPPFFSLGGNIINRGGIAKWLVRLARLLVGQVPGHLTATNILTNMFSGAVSGPSAAATSAMGSVMSPLELGEGYDPNYSVVVNICSTLTEILIPPSSSLILYPTTVGGASAAALFMGSYLTGTLLGIAVVRLAVFLAVRKGYKASATKEEDPAWKIVLEAVPSLLVVITIIGGILTDVFTTAEAGVVMCLYCTLLIIIYREMSIKTFYDLFADTMGSSVTILFLTAASSIMSYVMSHSGIPVAISEGLTSVSNNRYMVILVTSMFLLVVGMFLDLTLAVPISIPILLPITTSVGVSPVHFRLMLIMNLGIGFIIPPVGSYPFVGCGIGHIKIEGVTKYVAPIPTAMVISLLLVSFIPAIPLLVPHLCGLVPSMWW